MEIKDFVASFADQFDDTDPEMITDETVFRDLEEWSSLIALSVLNMVNKQYGYNMTFDEMKPCVTVGDLYNTVSSKVG